MITHHLPLRGGQASGTQAHFGAGLRMVCSEAGRAERFAVNIQGPFAEIPSPRAAGYSFERLGPDGGSRSEPVRTQVDIPSQTRFHRRYKTGRLGCESCTPD